MAPAQIKRRVFILALAGASLALPGLGRAQERARRLAVLMQYTEDNAEAQRLIGALHDGLQKLGWVEGRNLQIDHRWGGTDMNMLQSLAKEIVASKPDLIFSSSSPTTRILKQETTTIPIVFGNLVDPIGQGFVASLARPGGNVTGFVNLEPSVAGKYVELLKEIAPRVARVAIFYNPATAPYHEIYLNPFNAAARSLGLVPIVAPIRDLGELETVMATQAREPNTGLVAMPDGFQSVNYREIAALAARYKLPAVYATLAVARAGGLLAYSNDAADNYRRAASYVDRILKGEKPSDLPVQFPVKFELVVNLKAAKALGLDVPTATLLRADEVIE
jgi:putative tryptophan/tyrosine transport system substrate-binding protein